MSAVVSIGPLQCRVTREQKGETMNDVTNAQCWLLPDAASVPDGDEGAALIMGGWPVIAAVAWAEYRMQGRGTVMLDAEGAAAYHAGSPCECHQHLVDTYDPEQQVVVALHDGTKLRSITVVAGWPAPPDAYRITPGERLHLTAH